MITAASTAFSQIDRQVFKDELDEALIWAVIEAKNLIMNQSLNQNEKWVKLTRIIDKRYPKVRSKGRIFLAATAMLLAEIGG